MEFTLNKTQFEQLQCELIKEIVNKSLEKPRKFINVEYKANDKEKLNTIIFIDTIVALIEPVKGETDIVCKDNCHIFAELPIDDVIGMIKEAYIND